MNEKPGRRRSHKLPGRRSKWGIRLPIVERRMFSRIKKLDSGDIHEKMMFVSHSMQNVLHHLDRQQNIVQLLVDQFKKNGGQSREEKIQAIERAVRKEDALKLKQIKINMYVRLIDFYQNTLSTQEAAEFLSHFRRRKSNFNHWRQTVGYTLRQKRKEWEIKARKESPVVMRKYVINLLTQSSSPETRPGPRKVE